MRMLHAVNLVVQRKEDALAMNIRRSEGITNATPSLMEFCIAKDLMEYFNELHMLKKHLRL